jgi:hypothetical protein
MVLVPGLPLERPPRRVAALTGADVEAAPVRQRCVSRDAAISTAAALAGLFTRLRKPDMPSWPGKRTSEMPSRSCSGTAC